MMNNKWKKLILMFVSIIFLFAPDLLFSEVPDKTVLDSFLKETVKRYRIPGLAVAVADDKGCNRTIGKMQKAKCTRQKKQE